jgi:XTP/dITP diphosphohydrolase
VSAHLGSPVAVGGRHLALATANPHKLREIAAILAPFGWTVAGLERWPEIGELPETAKTFAENALQKARALFAHTGLLSVADDSGLEVLALGGLPGVHSHRFTSEATHEANNAELLRRLQGMDDRRARFRCAMAVVGPMIETTVEGCCEGRIGLALRGEGGFGYDPLFLPDEAPGRTMAQLPEAEKNAISHRGRAFRQLPAILERLGQG